MRIDESNCVGTCSASTPSTSEQFVLKRSYSGRKLGQCCTGSGRLQPMEAWNATLARNSGRAVRGSVRGKAKQL